MSTADDAATRDCATGRAAGLRPRRRFAPVSRSLELLVALVLGLIVALTGEQIWRIRSNLIAGTALEMARLDMVFAEQTGRAVETVDLILRGVIETLRDRRGSLPVDAAAMNDLLQRRIAGVRQIAALAITDASGRVLYTSSPPASAAQLPPAGQALLKFHAAHDDDTLQVSEPIRRDEGGWVVLLTRRINGADGSFAGIGVARLNLGYFEDFYRAVELNDNGAIVLHRRDGVLLARYPHREDLIGVSYADLPPFKDVLAHAMAGTVLMDSPLDGSRRVLAIRALKLFPLAVNVSVDEDRVLAGWRRETGIFGLAALGGCLVIGVLVVLLAQRSRQIGSLLGQSRVAHDAAEQANVRLRAEMEERERAEAALRQAQRIEAMGQLTGGVAHDFNNVLTVLLGNIDLLQQSAVLPPGALSRLERMRGAAERGAKLTDQLLAFARRQPLLPRAMELNAVVRGMTELLESAIGSTIRVVTRLTDNPWPALVDPTQIELVILNLAINGRDAMPQGGVLTIETGNVSLGPPERPEDPPAGDYAMVSVRDTGIGMSPEVQAKAFDPFFTTKRPGQGSGLGLSQVYGLARQSGGGVRIESAVGEGTTVRVFLPRAADEVAPVAAPPAVAAAGQAHDARVLLVDDDEAVRSTTATILETMGYTVLEIGNGQHALDRLATDPTIAVLLTDVAMPGMNGAELARQARAVRPGLPIVFFSGYADPDAVAGDAILQRIVRKPFRASELAAQIEAALAGAGPAAG